MPIALRNSMVGSSWNSADTSGEAPMMSPPLSTSELRCLGCEAA